MFIIVREIDYLVKVLIVHVDENFVTNKRCGFPYLNSTPLPPNVHANMGNSHNVMCFFVVDSFVLLVFP